MNTSLVAENGFEVRDWGVQRVDAADRPLETFEAWVTEVRCPRCGYEARSVVDVEIACLGGNPAGFRAFEDRAFMVGFREKHARQSPACSLR